MRWATALLVPPLRGIMFRAMLPGLAGRRRAEEGACGATTVRRPARPIVIEGAHKRLDDDRDTKPSGGSRLLVVAAGSRDSSPPRSRNP